LWTLLYSLLLPYTTLFRSIESLERMAHDEPGSLGAIAFAPAGLVANQDAEARMAIAVVDLHQPDRANEPFVAPRHDAQHQAAFVDRKSTRLNSSHRTISYA